MKPMTAAEAAKWEKVRGRGKKRYVLVTGVLLWGVVTGIVWSIVMSAVQGWDRLPLYLILALILFPIGGIFFGLQMWKILESRYAATPEEKASNRK
jgi:hypothetical protein